VVPNFLIDEVTVRESGESSVFDASEYANRDLLLTFGITHAVEHESIAIEIHGSTDGVNWTRRPILSFAPKSYCGTYNLTVPCGQTRYLKATWKLMRWSRDGHRPFFRFYLFAQPSKARVAAVAGAA
jgi:hypothetical protein